MKATTRQQLLTGIILIATVCLSVALTVFFFSSETLSSGSSGGKTLEDSNRLTADQFAFIDAQKMCLEAAISRAPNSYRNALYVDERSTQNLGGGYFKVFVKTDTAIARVDEGDVYVCRANTVNHKVDVNGVNSVSPRGKIDLFSNFPK